MRPPKKRAKECEEWDDDLASRYRAAFSPCQHVYCFLTSLFPVNRCRRVGASIVFLFSVVAIHHSEANTPYLRAVGPVELRFQKRVAYIPPKKSPSSAGGEPSPPETTGPVAGAPALPGPAATAKDPPSERPPEMPPEKPALAPPQAELKPIVPDAFAPRLLPEEVLPFFVIPESREERSISTATFKQK